MIEDGPTPNSTTLLFNDCNVECLTEVNQFQPRKIKNAAALIPESISLHTSREINVQTTLSEDDITYLSKPKITENSKKNPSK
jgi:hypothetical protein